MTQHITQEQAVALAKNNGVPVANEPHDLGIIDNEVRILCNAAIQHYIDSIDTSRERVEKDTGNVQVAQPASAPAAVSGWKLVPVDATRNQLVTGWNAIAGKLDHQSLAHLYGAMLAAAPTGELS